MFSRWVVWYKFQMQEQNALLYPLPPFSYEKWKNDRSLCWTNFVENGGYFSPFLSRPWRIKSWLASFLFLKSRGTLEVREASVNPSPDLCETSSSCTKIVLVLNWNDLHLSGFLLCAFITYHNWMLLDPMFFGKITFLNVAVVYWGDTLIKFAHAFGSFWTCLHTPF